MGKAAAKGSQEARAQSYFRDSYLRHAIKGSHGNKGEPTFSGKPVELDKPISEENSMGCRQSD